MHFSLAYLSRYRTFRTMLTVLTVCGLVFSKQSIFAAEPQPAKMPTPSPYLSAKSFLPNGKETHAQQVIETKLSKYLKHSHLHYQVNSLQVVVKGDWAYATIPNLMDDKVVNKSLTVLAHRLPNGEWLALLPQEGDGYFQWLSLVPETLISRGTKEQIGSQSTHFTTHSDTEQTTIQSIVTFSASLTSNTNSHIFLPYVTSENSGLAETSLHLLDSQHLDSVMGLSFKYDSSHWVPTLLTDNGLGVPDGVSIRAVGLANELENAWLIIAVFKNISKSDVDTWIAKYDYSRTGVPPSYRKHTINGFPAVTINEVLRDYRGTPPNIRTIVNTGTMVYVIEYASMAADYLMFEQFLKEIQFFTPSSQFSRSSLSIKLADSYTSAGKILHSSQANLPNAQLTSTCCGVTDPEYNPFPCPSNGSHGNCTWWVRYRRIGDNRANLDMCTGNANTWDECAARNYPDLLASSPSVNDAAVWIGQNSNGIDFNHVQFVERVNDNGTYHISEMNWPTATSLGTCQRDFDQSRTANIQFIRHPNGGTSCPAPTQNDPSDGQTYPDRTISFSWQSISGCTFNGYTFRVKNTSDMESGGTNIIDTGEGGTSRTETFGSQWDNQDLYWGVKAANAPSGSNWSVHRFRIQPGSGGSLNPPEFVSPGDNQTINTRSVSFSWQNPNAPNQTGYTFRLNTDSNPDSQPWLEDTGVGNEYTSRNFTFSSDGTFYWHMRTWNSQGQASSWRTRRFQIDTSSGNGNNTPPTPPSDLSVGSTTANSITLQWNDNSSNEKGFYLYRWGDDGAKWDFLYLASVGENSTSYTDSSLSCHIDYFYKMKAYNDAGTSAETGWVQATTADCSAPNSPVLTSPLNNEFIDEGQTITLQWNPVTSANEYYGEISGGPAGTFTFNWQAESIKEIGSQLAGYPYIWKVKARGQGGESSWSDEQIFIVRPAAPTNLIAQTATCNQVNLAWTDNAGSEDGYNIYLNNSWIDQVGSNVTAYQSSNLSPNTDYSYVVKAFRGSIESGESNNASTNTGDCAVPADVSVSESPEPLVIDADTATVAYRFTEHNGIDVHIAERSAVFTLLDGVSTISAEIGPYSNDITIPANGTSEWVDYIYLPPEVALTAQQNGDSGVLLQTIFRGTDSSDRSVFVDSTLRIDFGTCDDPLEPNGTIQQASATVYGQVRNAVICPIGDYDFYSFTGTEGDRIQIDIDAAVISSSLDSVVSLYDSDGTTLLSAADDNDNSVDSRLIAQLPHTGQYYFSVRPYSTTGGGAAAFYKVKLSVDNTEPSVEILSPLNDGWLHPTKQLITVIASDNETIVDHVDFYFYDSEWSNPAWVWLGSDLDSSDSWSWQLDTSTLTETQGAALFVYAYDSVGHPKGFGTYNLKVDHTPPSSAVLNLPEITTSTQFLVEWEGNDNRTERNQLTYDVQYQLDCTSSWKDWLIKKNLEQASFTGQANHSYCFRSRSYDLAGNSESWPDQSDSRTKIVIATTTMPQNATAPGISFNYLRSFGEIEKPYLADKSHVNRPHGLFIDASNNLFVAEEQGKRILKYNASGANLLAIGKAGVCYTADDVFCTPNDMATDSSGNIWVADGNRIVQYTVAGAYLQQLPVERSWEEGDDNTHFKTAMGIAINKAGQVFVADRYNHRVQVYAASNGVLSHLATLGATGQSGSDNTHFNQPYRLAVDSQNRLYVLDYGNQRVQRCSFTTTWSCATFVTGLNNAQGIAVDSSNNLFVADTENGRIHKCSEAGSCSAFVSGVEWTNDVAVDSNGNIYAAAAYESYVYKLQPNGQRVGIFMGAEFDPYLTDGSHFNQPRVAVDKDSNLIVVEESGQRILKLAANGSLLWSIGEPGVDGDDNQHLRWPHGATTDNNGNVYVASSDRVQIFSANGVYMATIGGERGTGNTQFSWATGVAVDANGTIYVSDGGNHRVQVYDKNRQFVATLGVTGEIGTDNAHFNLPTDVAVDTAGNLYVADHDNCRVQKFNVGRVYQKTFGRTGSCTNNLQDIVPEEVAIDAQGQVYVASAWQNRVQVFGSNGDYLTTLGGAWGDRAGEIRDANSVALDKAGNVYVGDFQNARIQVFAPNTASWKSASLNGFGEITNESVTALETFNGQLFAGITNYSFGGTIWRSTDGSSWQRVSEPGFTKALSTTNPVIFDLIEFNGKLYAGTGVWWEDGIPGQVWRSSNGQNWEQVLGDNFGETHNGGVVAFGKFKTMLYAATINSNSGLEIWRTVTGNANDWTRVVSNGFSGGSAYNIGYGFQEFGGQLYIGVEDNNEQNRKGLRIFRTSDGVTWKQTNQDGFGDPNNIHPGSLLVFQNALYATTRNEASGGQMWRSSDGQTWKQIVGNGFGDSNNYKIESLQSFNNVLYAIAGNTSTGIEVWNSNDGNSWQQVNSDGFGSRNNEWTLWSNATTVFGSLFYVGSTNTANGAVLWRYSDAGSQTSKVYLPVISR